MSEHSGETKTRQDRATHFLCFPISSDTTIHDLSSSIAHFRDISTDNSRSKPRRRLETRPDGTTHVVVEHDVDTGEPTTGRGYEDKSVIEGPSTNSQHKLDNLQVLPPIAHRAAGTYHLTVGTMNLNEEAEMVRAKELLQSLDLGNILRQAARGAPAGSKEARRWDAESSSERSPTSLTRSIARPESTMSTDDSPGPASPLVIALAGLGAFPSPKNARVIWARPKEQTGASGDLNTRPDFRQDGRLYNFALHLNDIFRKAGFIKETRPLVLHATVSNMRYAVQPKGGRTSKGKTWIRGKRRWQEGLVDVRSLCEIFNNFNGDPNVSPSTVQESDSDSHELDNPAENSRDYDFVGSKARPDQEFLWARNIQIDRVAICKMGATKAEDQLWGEYYPPIAEQLIL